MLTCSAEGRGCGDQAPGQVPSAGRGGDGSPYCHVRFGSVVRAASFTGSFAPGIIACSHSITPGLTTASQRGPSLSFAVFRWSLERQEHSVYRVAGAALPSATAGRHCSMLGGTSHTIFLLRASRAVAPAGGSEYYCPAGFPCIGSARCRSCCVSGF